MNDELAGLLALFSRPQFQSSALYPDRRQRRISPKQPSSLCYPGASKSKYSTAQITSTNRRMKADSCSGQYYNQHDHEGSQQRGKGENTDVPEDLPQNLHSSPMGEERTRN